MKSVLITKNGMSVSVLPFTIMLRVGGEFRGSCAHVKAKPRLEKC